MSSVPERYRIADSDVARVFRVLKLVNEEDRRKFLAFGNTPEQEHTNLCMIRLSNTSEPFPEETNRDA